MRNDKISEERTQGIVRPPALLPILFSCFLLRLLWHGLGRDIQVSPFTFTSPKCHQGDASPGRPSGGPCRPKLAPSTSSNYVRNPWDDHHGGCGRVR
ncbi:hypothetical protein GGR52DRAFT_152074 [Hypoxylon sp. FL1284]|nr:hypothetical protein GGR52DRAFT_152074 [Hypoxylon sp. FL1284]